MINEVHDSSRDRFITMLAENLQIEQAAHNRARGKLREIYIGGLTVDEEFERASDFFHTARRYRLLVNARIARDSMISGKTSAVHMIELAIRLHELSREWDAINEEQER